VKEARDSGLTLKPFLLQQAERIKKHAGVMASQSGGLLRADYTPKPAFFVMQAGE
jgi:hypothetical protein